MIKNNILFAIIAVLLCNTNHPSYIQMQEEYQQERKKIKKRPRKASRSYNTQSADNTNYPRTNYTDQENRQTDNQTYQRTQSRNYYQVTQSTQTDPQTYDQQPRTVSTLMGQITITISTGTETMFNNPEQTSIQIPSLFSLEELSYGIELFVSIYPPTTNSYQEYLLVAFLKSANGSKVSQSIMQKNFNTLPTIMTIYYRNQQLLQKSFFEKPSGFTESENIQLFNSKCPITKKLVIQVINNQIVVS